MKTLKQLKFKRTPKCENCNDTAHLFSAFRIDESEKRHWMFVCQSCSDRAIYPVEIVRFFHSPSSTTDWIAHLHEKGWMDQENFAAMMHRFRSATESFNQV